MDGHKVSDSYWSYCASCDGYHEAGKVTEWKDCWVTDTGLRHLRFNYMLRSNGLIMTVVVEQMLKERGAEVEPSDEELRRFYLAEDNVRSGFDKDGNLLFIRPIGLCDGHEMVDQGDGWEDCIHDCGYRRRLK